MSDTLEVSKQLTDKIEAVIVIIKDEKRSSYRLRVGVVGKRKWKCGGNLKSYSDFLDGLKLAEKNCGLKRGTLLALIPPAFREKA